MTTHCSHRWSRILSIHLRPESLKCRRQAQGRAVHAGGDDVGENQESPVQPVGRTAGIVREAGRWIPFAIDTFRRKEAVRGMHLGSGLRLQQPTGDRPPMLNCCFFLHSHYRLFRLVLYVLMRDICGSVCRNTDWASSSRAMSLCRKLLWYSSATGEMLAPVVAGRAYGRSSR